MKKEKIVLDRVEKENEHGVIIVNELVEFKKVYTDSKGNEKALEKEYVWYQTIGDYTSTFCRYKREKNMRDMMKQYNFFME